MVLLAFRNVLRNPRRSLLTAFAIAIGLLSSNLLASLARGLSTQLIEDAIFTLTGHLQIHDAEYLSDPVVAHRFEPSTQLKDILSTHPDIAAWSMRVRLPAVIMSERDSQGVTVLGIDPEREKGLSFIAEAHNEGRMLSQPDEVGIVLGRRMAEQLQTEIGKRVVLMGQDTSGAIADRGIRVIGLYQTELAEKEKAYAFVGREIAQELFGMGNAVSEISLRASTQRVVDSLTEQISEQVPGLDVQSWKTLEPLVTALVKVQSGFLYIWFGIVILTISFGLVNTVFMSVYERVRELGLYQALGMTPRQIQLHVFLESLLLLLIGALLGNLLSVLTLAALSQGIDLSAFAKGTEMFGAKSVVYPTLLFADTVVVNVVTVVVGGAASLYPAWRASCLQPAVALGRG